MMGMAGSLSVSGARARFLCNNKPHESNIESSSRGYSARARSFLRHPGDQQKKRRDSKTQISKIRCGKRPVLVAAGVPPACITVAARVSRACIAELQPRKLSGLPLQLNKSSKTVHSPLLVCRKPSEVFNGQSC